jgi:FkbM family methyltransferase
MAIPDLLSILPYRPTITVVDIGAMSLGEGSDPYQPLIDAGIANIIGFEPVEAEHAKLQAMAKPGRTYLPYAIGDGTVQPFHICNYAMTSSLLRPNHALTDHFTSLSEVMQVVKTVEMQTHRLDDIPEVRKTDFVKIDIQGAELQVFQSAKHVLANTLLVQSEVEFVPLYQDQPLFGDIDAYLRSTGLLFHRFTGMCGRPLRPLPFQPTPSHPSFSQALWCDAYFLRDLRTLDRMGPEKLLKTAILAHYICESVDVVYRCLSIYDQLMDSNLVPRYVRLLNQPSG